MKTQYSIHENDINFGADRVLFIEGTNRSFDIECLRVLFEGVEKPPKLAPLSASFSLSSVAQALKSYTPQCFFVLDRDYHDDEFIDRVWNDFPNGCIPRLLYWRKKEIENYFLDPDLLMLSPIMNERNRDEIENTITKYANMYLFMFVANRVIVEIRERLKKKWIDIYKNRDDFKDIETTKRQLCNNPQLVNHCKLHQELIDPLWIQKQIEVNLSLFTGDGEKVEWGKGKWLELMPGHEILMGVISECCSIPSCSPDDFKNRLNSIITQIIKHTDRLPDDFRFLRDFFGKEATR